MNSHRIKLLVTMLVLVTTFVFPQLRYVYDSTENTYTVEMQKASAQVAHGTIAVTGGSPAAKGLANASSCQQQVAVLTAQVTKHRQELDQVLKECYGTTYEKWARCKDCGPTKKSRKPHAVVVECVVPAKKQGNTCICDGGPLWKDDAGKGHGTPVLVKTKGSKPWFRTYTCTYDADDLEAFAKHQDRIQKRTCTVDGYPLLSELAGQVNDTGAMVEVPDSQRVGGLCTRTGQIIKELYARVILLRSNRNGVPSFDRDHWEELWNRVQGLKKDVADLRQLYIGLRTGICEVCKCKGTEPTAKACKRWAKGLGKELDGLHETDRDLQEQIDTVDKRVDGLEGDVERLSDNEWLVGPSIYGVLRFGEEMPRSVVLAGDIDYRGFVDRRNGWLAGAHFGYAWTNLAENHVVLGGRAGYLRAFDDDRETALFIGGRGSAEITERGTNAADFMGQIGVQFCPGAICIEPWVALGGSSVVRVYDDINDRDGRMQLVGAGALGLNAFFRLGGNGHDRKPKEEPAPPRTTTTTSESISTTETVTSPPYDKGYRE